MLQPITLTSKSKKQNPTSKRNRFPLFSLDFTVAFLLPTGDFNLEAKEVSHDEVRVTCSAGNLPQLVPRTAHHRPDEKINHKATLLLDKDFKLDVVLQVLGCRRYSQQGFNIAFRIVELSDKQQAKLESFLIKALEKNIPTANMFG